MIIPINRTRIIIIAVGVVSRKRTRVSNCLSIPRIGITLSPMANIRAVVSGSRVAQSNCNNRQQQ